ncbi:MAG: leucine-rich repeat domain-containing protein [archaeon]|nr:leucine-rich repeat domain-containing protein [archaeon]
MEKVNLKTDKVELEDKIECIHTAVVDISFNEFEETIMDDRFEGKIINMISSENLPGIDLEPREKFRAFKSWVAGIAEAGTDAFRIQSDIDNAAKQMYPLAEKILKFMALADPYFIPEFLNKITRECVHEGVRHEACIIANITPLLEMVVFDPAKERHRDGDDWIFNEGDNLYYLEGYREILSAIFDSEFPLKLFTQNPKYIGFLRLPDAVKIPNFKEAFSHSNKNVRKSVALNSEAIYFDEFNKLLSYKTESSSEVRQAATRNPNGMKIYEKILEKSELPSEEIEALRELSIIIGKPLPKVDRFIWEDNYEKLKRNADQHVGVMIEDKHVRGLGLVFQDNDKLTYLPESIGNLKFLEYLALYRNSLVKIPKTIGNLKELKILTLGHNKLKSLPESIGQLKKLEKLCLNTNNLSVFPDCLTHLDSLRDLNLKKNQFNYLPESIGELKSLQILNLEKNQINTLPLSIGNFPQLEILRLGVNKLQTLPESIGQLSSLQEFILGANNLISLPESIGDLINLRKLCLNTNKLRVIPNSIKNLSNLKLINLYYNEFTQIPEVLNEIKTRGCKVILNIEDYNSFDFSNQGILDALDDYISYNTDDLAKKMKITNMADLRWLRSRLNFLAEKGLILLIEENGNNYWRIE